MGSSSAVCTFSFVVILFAGATLAEFVNLTYKDCGSVMSKVESVSYNGTKGNIALLKKGTNVQLRIDLLSKDDSKTLKADVHGIVAGIPVKFPLGDPDACEKSNVTCPIIKEKVYDYAPVIYVSPNYPTLKLVVKWEVKDDNGKDLICILVPAQISD